MFGADVEHLFEVAILPALRIAAGDDHGAGFRDFGLAKGGLAELLLLLAIADDDEAPGLQVVAAGSFQSGANDLFEISRVDGDILKVGGGAAVFNGLAEKFFCGEFGHGFPRIILPALCAAPTALNLHPTLTQR